MPGLLAAPCSPLLVHPACPAHTAYSQALPTHPRLPQFLRMLRAGSTDCLELYDDRHGSYGSCGSLGSLGQARWAGGGGRTQHGPSVLPAVPWCLLCPRTGTPAAPPAWPPWVSRCCCIRGPPDCWGMQEVLGLLRGRALQRAARAACTLVSSSHPASPLPPPVPARLPAACWRRASRAATPPARRCWTPSRRRPEASPWAQPVQHGGELSSDAASCSAAALLPGMQASRQRPSHPCTTTLAAAGPCSRLDTCRVDKRWRARPAEISGAQRSWPSKSANCKAPESMSEELVESLLFPPLPPHPEHHLPVSPSVALPSPGSLVVCLPTAAGTTQPCTSVPGLFSTPPIPVCPPPARPPASWRYPVSSCPRAWACVH